MPIRPVDDLPSRILNGLLGDMYYIAQGGYLTPVLNLPAVGSGAGHVPMLQENGSVRWTPVDGSPVNQTAPRIAAIWCSGPNQLMVQASDQSFDIEIQFATDTAGTGATAVEGSPFPGTTTTYTDPVLDHTHRARHVKEGLTPGPWTRWVDVCFVGDPACALPSWTELPDYIQGTLSLVNFEDPQQRLVSVEFRTKSGTGAWTQWLAATPGFLDNLPSVQPLLSGQARGQAVVVAHFGMEGDEILLTGVARGQALVSGVLEYGQTVQEAVYSARVTLADPASYIEYRVTYYDCDANLVQAGNVVEFPGDPTTPPPTADTLGPLCSDVVFHSSGSDTDDLIVTSALTEIPGKLRVVFDTRGYDFVRVQYQHFEDDPIGPANSYAVIQCRAKESVDEADFRAIGVIAGPVIRLDQPAGPPRWSEWVQIAPECLGDMEFRRLTQGGDDATWIANRSFRIQFRRAVVADEPPDTQQPPDEENPEVQSPQGGLVAWFRGTTGKIFATSGEGSGGPILYRLPIEGLSSPDDVVAAGWTLFNNDSGGLSNNTLELVGSPVDVGTQALHFNITHPAWIGGQLWFERTFSGLAPGDTYKMSARIRFEGRPWFQDPVFSVIGGGSGGQHYVEGSKGSADGQWATIWTQNTANANGEITVRFGNSFMLGVTADFSVYFDGEILIEGNAPAGEVLVEWQDQSGNGNHAVWNGGSNPTDGGDKVVFHSGAKFELPAGMLNGHNAVELYAVVSAQADPNGGSNDLWHLGLQTSDYPNGSGNIIEGAGRATAASAGNPSPALTGWNLYHVRVSQAAVQVSLNQTVLATFGPGPITWDSLLTIGGGVSFKEIRIYGLTTPHTDGERDQEYGDIVDGNPDLPDDADPDLPELPPPGEPLPPLAGRKVLAGALDVTNILTVPPFNGGYGNGSFFGDNTATNLNYAMDNNLGMIPILLGNNELRVNGNFNLQFALNNIEEIFGPHQAILKQAYDAQCLRGIITADDIGVEERWGPGGIPSSAIDAIAKKAKEVFGFPIPCFIRADPIKLEARRYNWVYTDGSIAQYVGPIQQHRWPVGTYIANMLAAAQRQQLRLICGCNMPNGGDGSSGKPGTRTGARGNMWYMSATDIRRDAGAIAQAIKAGKLEPMLTVWFRDWAGSDDKPYLRQSDIREAWEYVLGIMS